MALLLVILGIVLWLMVSPMIGLICVIVGLVLFFVPASPYGYSHWHRGPP
jgi:hypothetical protein